MGLTGAKESRDPYTLGGAGAVVCFEEGIKVFGYFVGYDVFLDFVDEVLLVIGLNDALNGAIDWFFEKVSNIHECNLYSSILKAR